MELYPLVDLHIGDGNTDVKLFKRFIGYILEQPYRYITLQGDLMNNALKNSVSNVYNESMSPREQKLFLINELRPLADRILCIVPGNHEARSAKEADVSLMEDLAIALNKHELYQENGCFLKVTLGTQTRNGKRVAYNGLCVHGSGGGAKTGASVNRLEDYAYSIEGLDLAITGHTHKYWASVPSKIVIDDKNEVIRQRNFACVNASAWQNYGGYGFRWMLKPGRKGVSPIILHGTKKQIDVIMSTGNGVD
jgi:UDP-2,3-diacylglucosamine pyrophosphatase LpxH